jgi:hypothetical protein
VGNDPINHWDYLGLAWTYDIVEGQVVVRYLDGFILPESKGETFFGKHVIGETKDYMNGSGAVREYTPTAISVAYGGENYEIPYLTLRRALSNISKEFTQQLLSANSSERAEMLHDFVLSDVKPSNSKKAAIAGHIDSALSIFAGSTAGGNPMMNTHGSGGLAQELLGIDSRDPTYTAKTEKNETAIAIGSSAMAIGGTFVAPRGGGPTIGKNESMRSNAKWGFRGAGTPANEAFNKGLSARGNSTDLLKHALNNKKPPSAYVSASESPLIAQFNFNSKQIFVIRPRNGIDVNKALGKSSPHPHELEVAIPWRVNANDIRAVTFPQKGISVLNHNWTP